MERVAIFAVAASLSAVKLVGSGDVDDADVAIGVYDRRAFIVREYVGIIF